MLDACWAETDEGRRVPHDVVEEMRRAGLFRMVVPSEFGGAATNLHTFVAVLETVVVEDAMVGSGFLVLEEEERSE